MKVLFVHPSASIYSEIYYRLEPLGLELVAQSARAAGHDVRFLDLQVFSHKDYLRELRDFEPDAVGFSLNYLARVAEVLDLALQTKSRLPRAFVFIGGHCATFIAGELLDHARGAVDAVVRGEGEEITPRLLEALPDGKLEELPGVVTMDGAGPKPVLVDCLEEYEPALDLSRRRRKYFIGILDPCGSIEFTRGCPWDCSFCSAWTFYGRSYRKIHPEVVAEQMARIEEPNAFIVDDVAFVHPEDGFAIGREIEKRKIKKRYYLETRCDVLLRNPEVFAYWKRLGMHFLFLGLEAIDDEGLELHRKRVTPDDNMKALEVARKLGVRVTVNLIADPGWDEERFRHVREWIQRVPEIVHLTVNTPYPGTESWYTDSRKLATLDYRLFDTEHAVLPTKLPLEKFYEELVMTQAVVRKHLGFDPIKKATAAAVKLLLRGQTNFFKMLFKFNGVFRPERQLAEHFREIEYAIRPPLPGAQRPGREDLYVHRPAASRRRAARA